MMHTNKYADFVGLSVQLADKIEAQAQQITELLGKYEPHETARDEIARSISALRGVGEELEGVRNDIAHLTISTFFPLNLPLYSMVLFAVMPSVFAERVYVRAPEIMQQIMSELEALLDVGSMFPAVKVKSCTRSTFIDLYVRHSDVVLFTGKYKNAVTVQKQCPEALFIFNGGGVNPAIVFQDSDVELAAKKIFEMRIFNSGQDCAGTDAIFVHEAVYDEFLGYLRGSLECVTVGPYGSPSTDIGPILKHEYVNELLQFLNKEKRHIVMAGKVDEASDMVWPYVIAKDLSEHSGDFHEFFAPVFYLLKFRDEAEVAAALTRDQILDYSMYITYFSATSRLQGIKPARLLRNCIINDVEQGNQPYGGYGSKANFIAFEKQKAHRPILISREIDSFYTNGGVI